MKFGVNTYIWGSTFGPADFHLLPRIKAGGFDGVEVPILEPAAFEVEAVRRACDGVGLARTAVANVPGGSSLASSDAGERQRARDHVAACVTVARDLGATMLAGPMFARRVPDRTAADGRGMEMGRRRWRDWRVCGRRRHRIGRERLNRFETYFLNTAADAARLSRRSTTRASASSSTFHANIEEKSIGAALRHAGPH
jgi:D-psicose/D-tagatose/L-ribulose 3-epimerase